MSNDVDRYNSFRDDQQPKAGLASTATPLLPTLKEIIQREL